MTAIGHVVLAAAPLFVCCDGALLSDPLVVGAAIAGTLFPDIDEPNSYIGRRLVFISLLLKEMGVRHRGVTHSFIWPVFMAIVAIFAFEGKGQTVWLAFAYGMLMHDIGDMLTKGGLDMFFWPISYRKTRLLPGRLAFYTGGAGEYLFLAMIIFGVSVGAGHVFE